MHIVHLVRQFRPGIGGIENFVENLARAQVKAGLRVSVVTLDRIFTDAQARLPRAELVDGVAIRRIPYRGSHRYPLAPAFLPLIADADLVHVHAVDFFCDAAAITRPLHGKPLVLSTHGGFFHTGRNRRAKQVYFATATRWALGRYRAVLASSEADLARFRQIRKGGIVAVENGVDVAKFADAASPSLRRHIVSIGRFAANKRLDRLLDLLRALIEREPGWRLTILGVPWDLDAAGIKALAQARGIAPAVEIRTGLADAEIRAALGEASFFASASEYEGFGIAAIEGMSAGLLPILSDIPAFRRLHELSGLGILGDFDRPGEIAARIEAALPQATAGHAAQRAAAIAFASRYDWSGVAARIGEIYRALLGRERRLILDIPVQVSGRMEAIRRLDDARRRGDTLGVAFLNSHAANLARRDGGFRDALRRLVVLNDGFGVDLASGLLYGRRFPENLNGTDFTPAYLEHSAFDHRIFLLGARAEVVAKAAQRLQAQFPRHRIVGFRDGYFGPEQEAEVVAQIRAAAPDLLLVAMGNPRQEIWIDRHLAATGARLALCVGAYLDFAAGAVPRAPAWLRALRSEWLFRLAIEPRRMWRRYLIGNAVFLAHATAQRRRHDRFLAGPAAAGALQSPTAADGDRHARAA